eukprot:CAMPEP_0113381170 /NCGR_PEP_ID=MMETSP0013_2-20120614/5151_1 /TAXON_ID=2843 ORGANISM="Skeletonema costatum, Strain 1716" /NCGR_SAMPLE_ID=MMETSP0013_2 /ASSEMBLY_ACC=CAM_ASM_000158 /LENGTH=742 /DNA_ID=CAMNT_0000263563 /DNA_START=64 /DNA_END=2292 /DNA_ORIENTATION=+ /assembly_acc=CAM_ASM_000158
MMHHPSPSSTTTTLLILIGLLTSTTTIIEALTLPNLIGAISHQQRHNHLQSQRRRQQQHHRRGSNGAPSSNTQNNGGNQMHPNSITLTIDDEDPSGLWNVMSSSSGAKKQRQQEQQRRLIRFGFHFFRVGRGGGSRGVSNDNSNGAANQRRAAATALQHQVQQSARPYGPVPRGGTLEDLVVLPSSSFAASSSTAATMAMHPSSSSSSANSMKNNKQRGLWSNVRNTMRGIRRTVIHSTVSTFINDSHNHNSASHHDNMRMNDNEMIMMHNLFDRHGDGAAINNMSVLRVGGMINRHLKSRRLSKVQAQGYAVESERASSHVNKAAVVTTVVRGGDASMTSTLSSSSSSSSAAVSSSSSATTSSTRSTATEETTFIIETPLFPIILPKAWEAPFKGTSSYSSTSGRGSTSTSSSSTSYIDSLEITIAPPEDPTSTKTTGAKPTPHQLQSATLPLIPKSTWESFTGNEFFHPETYDGLVSTGVLMGTTAMSAEYVNWSGDKKTDKFVKEHGSSSSDNDGDAKSSSWYEALDSSQEVLVWSGKFIGDKGELYGAELPIIKTTSIIHKSPKYLAELLMDSTKVKAYNKMSLGRDDVEVFQSGVDTTEEEGKFGNVGESKIVRNLTRPPMINSNLEFVTCMHARKLSHQDLQTLSSNNSDPNQPTDGYIVVSRAVTGGQWNSDDSNNVRNEIILGVNILRQVPNEPDKTELIAVTHVYSPMIPLMLAKNAGVKGAVDFVRDIRSLP